MADLRSATRGPTRHKAYNANNNTRARHLCSYRGRIDWIRPGRWCSRLQRLRGCHRGIWGPLKVLKNAVYMDSSRVSAKKITSRSRSKSDAVIYPACDEAVRASGHHGHPRTESQSVKRDLEGQRRLRLISAPVRPVMPCVSRSLCTSLGWVPPLRDRGQRRPRLELLVARPHSPYDSRELVRQRDRRLIPPAMRRGGDGPLL
jgi:hypothetical protein